jgi:DNA-binding CsgD family transcriptional regulator
MIDEQQLSERERVAAILIAYGNTNQDVARELGVSVRTVESERAQIMRKLGFKRRFELVRWALERGFLR